MTEVLDYYNKALVFGRFYAFLGFALWVATTVMAFVLAGSQTDLYYAVAGFTVAAGITVCLDLCGRRWITPFTVAFGSAALLISQSLWSEDREDKSRQGLLGVQLMAVGIQLGAIANSNGRDLIL